MWTSSDEGEPPHSLAPKLQAKQEPWRRGATGDACLSLPVSALFQVPPQAAVQGRCSHEYKLSRQTRRLRAGLGEQGMVRVVGVPAGLAFGAPGCSHDLFGWIEWRFDLRKDTGPGWFL
jgi:hypothetical protein